MASAQCAVRERASLSAGLEIVSDDTCQLPLATTGDGTLDGIPADFSIFAQYAAACLLKKWKRKPNQMPPTRKPGRRKDTLRGPGSPKAKKVLAEMMDGKTMQDAAESAGYKTGYARTKFYSSPTADWVKREFDRRMKAAMAKSAIHTDVITGALVEILMGSAADILPENEILQRARENGVDNLIKTITFDKNTGEITKLEMYDRLAAASQLRDNFGMKQEPRANTYEAERRIEVERSIVRIMESDNCDRPTAAERLADAVGKDSPLLPTISKLATTDPVH